MGTKDSKAKQYISDNERFADLCNYVLYNGEYVIKPEDLEERDTTEVISIFNPNEKESIIQRWRDILKNVEIKYTGSMYVVLIGVENQSNIHYAMPVKNMIYDALSYGKQVNKTKIFHSKRKDYKSEDEFLSGFTKNDKIIPVITITLYLGLKPWDGPRKLTDMMANLDERLLQFVSDYNINLVDPAEISDFDKFRTELKQLLEVLHNSYDREKLQDIIQKDERFKSLNRETVDAINTFAGTNIEVNEDEEVIDMCKAWEDQKEAGIQEGRKVGIKEGRKAGIQEGKFNVLLSLVQDGTLEINIAANKMNMTVDEFKNYMKTIKV